MALISCPECQARISDQAEQCIHCGFPLKRAAEATAPASKPLRLLEGNPTYSVTQASEEQKSSPHDRPTQKSVKTGNAPIFLVLAIIAFVLTLNTPKFLLFFPLMATLGCAVISLFRNERGRGGAVLVLVVTGGLLVLSEMGSGTPRATVEQQHLEAAEITQWNWRKDRNFGTRGTIKWNVQVRNKSSENIRSVRVEFTTYDKEGKLVASTFAYVSAIPPGEVRSEESYADLYGTEERAIVKIAQVNLSR